MNITKFVKVKLLRVDIFSQVLGTYFFEGRVDFNVTICDILV